MLGSDINAINELKDLFDTSNKIAIFTIRLIFSHKKLFPSERKKPNFNVWPTKNSINTILHVIALLCYA